jgi:hypothetical protein
VLVGCGGGGDDVEFTSIQGPICPGTFKGYCDGKCRRQPDEWNVFRGRLFRDLTGILYSHKKITIVSFGQASSSRRKPPTAPQPDIIGPIQDKHVRIGNPSIAAKRFLPGAGLRKNQPTSGRGWATRSEMKWNGERADPVLILIFVPFGIP